MRVSAVQLPAVESTQLEEVLPAVRDALATARGSDLVVLPEMWVPGYFAFDDYRVAAPLAGEVKDFLGEAARELGCHLHGGSFVEEREGRLYNTSVLFDPSGRQIASYSKIHLFGYQSRESAILSPGSEPTVVATEIGSLGLATCYDLRFPELFRRMTDMGAEMILIASAWPHPRAEAWSTLLKARALENQSYVVAANSVGPTESGSELCGLSAIVSPSGVVVTEAGDQPCVITADIERGTIAESRQEFPVLADRRLLGPTVPELVFSRPNERPLRMPVGSVAIAGFTGREPEAVAEYVAKLEDEGIAAPESTPMLFACGADRVLMHDSIDVIGSHTCGEVEYVVLVTKEGTHITVGSDHTDREVEQDSIPMSKQITPKVVARTAWRLSDVADHWDDLILRSWVGPERRPYQETKVSYFLSPEDLLDLIDPEPGTIIFAGTVSSIEGGFDFDPLFEGSIIDPVLDREITFRYLARQIGAQ